LEGWTANKADKMINAVLVFNNAGQPRLTKFYTQLVRCSLPFSTARESFTLTVRSQETSVQQRLISEIFTLVSHRAPGSCNFLPLPPLLSSQSTPSATSNTSSLHTSASIPSPDVPSLITYRHYATLYFIIISTSTESPLALIDLIQVYVEALDRLFEDVCELDLIYNFETLHATLAEMIVGGVVVETGLEKVVEGVKAQGKVPRRPVNEKSALGGMGMGGNFAWAGR
jgi:AP-3 complex subunit sigma